jgi:hypothetical protein
MNNTDTDFLLFLPDKVAEVMLEINEHVTERLLQRDLNAFDWHITDLWRVAVFHAVSATPVKALPYYHKLLEWTEADPQQHSQVLCATAHVFAIDRQFKDAQHMLQIAMKKANSPGRIPFFIAKVAYAQGDFQQTFQAIRFFLRHYTTRDALRLHAQSIQLMLLDEAGYKEAAQELLGLIAEEHSTWESHFLAATFSPCINLSPLSERIQALQAKHHALAMAHTLSEASSSLIAWYLPQRYKCVKAPYGADYRADLTHHHQNIKARMDFLVEHEFAVPDLTAYPADQKRIAIIGDFLQTSVADLSSLFISLCREHSITLMSTGAFPLDISEEHWMRTLTLDSRLENAYLQVRMQQPDLIIYLHNAHLHKHTDYLSTQRLAPWQVLWATEPVVSVSENIDEILLYASTNDTIRASALFPDSQLTYLPGSPVKKRRAVAEPVSAKYFNFDPERHYYYCPFPVTEIHYDFYAHCAEILSLDPAGEILFSASNTPIGEQYWRAQLNTLYPETAARMHILPPLSVAAEIGVIQNITLLLEPLYNPLKHRWWQGLLLGTPVLHYDDGESTGAWLTSMYRPMAWTESTVTEPQAYAPCAVKLAQDPEVKSRYQAQLENMSLDFSALTDFVHLWTAQKLQPSTQ